MKTPLGNINLVPSPPYNLPAKFECIYWKCFDEKWPEMESKEDLFTALQTQIDRAKEYVDRALVLEKKGIDGGGKLTKRIRAELKFLTGVG